MSGRRRYVYRPDPTTGELVALEIDRDEDLAPRSTGDLGKFEYGVPVDGVFISDRHDYKRYLKATGTVPASEYKGEWAAAEKERVRAAEGKHDTRERREQVGRAIYQLEKKKGRR